jgi:hypothetical protein
MDWGFVEYRIPDGPGRKVNGWAQLRDTQPLSTAEIAALPQALPPAAEPSPPPAATASAPAALPVATPSAPPAAASQAPPPAPADTSLKFDQPVPFGPLPVNGRSIEELARSVPMFAPLEGLDEAIWKKTCTSCHQWNRQRLCDQGVSYSKNPSSVLRIQHPFGGAYKLALMNWAKSGCE